MHFGKVIVLSLLIVLLAKVCIRMVHALMARAPKNLRILDLAAKKVLDKAVSYGIAFLAILIILDLLGVNTASLITVLGVAGLEQYRGRCDPAVPAAVHDRRLCGVRLGQRNGYRDGILHNNADDDGRTLSFRSERRNLGNSDQKLYEKRHSENGY